MYQSQQKGYAENTWMGGGTMGLRADSTNRAIFNAMEMAAEHTKPPE